MPDVRHMVVEEKKRQRGVYQNVEYPKCKYATSKKNVLIIKLIKTKNCIRKNSST